MNTSVFPRPTGVKKPPRARRSDRRKASSRESTSAPFESAVRPYLNDMGAVSLLTAEEEIWLAQRIACGQAESW